MSLRLDLLLEIVRFVQVKEDGFLEITCSFCAERVIKAAIEHGPLLLVHRLIGKYGFSLVILEQLIKHESPLVPILPLLHLLGFQSL